MSAGTQFPKTLGVLQSLRNPHKSSDFERKSLTRNFVGGSVSLRKRLGKVEQGFLVPLINLGHSVDA